MKTSSSLATVIDVIDRSARALGKVGLLLGGLDVSGSNPVPATITNTPAVTVAGVSTATAQATAQSSLDLIEGDTANISTHATSTDTHVAAIDAKTAALGQAAAAASSPVVLPSAQETSLRDVSDRVARALGVVVQGAAGLVTSPWFTILSDGAAALGTLANPLKVDGGTGALFDVKDRAGRALGVLAATTAGGAPLGQALAAGSVPVVLTAAQIASLAQESGHLANIDTDTLAMVTYLASLDAKSLTVGAKLAAASAPVALATDQLSTLATQTTLAQVKADLDALFASIAATGGAAPANAVYVGGKSGSNIVPLLVDSSGHTLVAGAGAAGAALTGNPVLTAGSDGTNTVIQRVTAGGVARVSQDFSYPTTNWPFVVSATLPTAGVAIKSSAAIFRFLYFINTTGGSIILMAFDRTTTPGAGAVPLWQGNTLATGLGASMINAIEGGFPVGTGLWIVASSTINTYTAIASTAVSYYCVYA